MKMERAVVNEVLMVPARPRAVRAGGARARRPTVLGSSAFFSNALSVCESECAD
jgi:hypothetical protein